MTRLATYPPPGSLGAITDPSSPGGGALLFMYGIPLAGAAIGAAVAGQGHRFVGGGVGLIAGIAGMILASKAITASQGPVAPDQLPPPPPITDLTAWRATPFGSATDPNSPQFACMQA